jgi:hypothetical protein
MDLKLEDLIAMAMRLPPEDGRYLVDALAKEFGYGGVSDVAAPRYVSHSKDPSSKEIGMKSVTVVIPDDLATQAQAAGLLADESMVELIRRALREQNADNSSNEGGPVHQRRRLVLQSGRLVVEAFPGEQPITDTEVSDLLNRMEW